MSWVKIAAITLFLISLLVVWLTFEVWAAAFLGLLFAISLNGPADWIRSKWIMRAWVATLLSMLMVLTVLTGLGLLIVPPLVGQADVLGKKLPAAVEESLNWLEDRTWGRKVVRRAEALSGMAGQQSSNEASDRSNLISQDLATDAPQQHSGAGSDNGNDGGSSSGASDSTDHVKSMIVPVLQTMVATLSVTVWTVMLIVVSFVVTLYVALNPGVYRRGFLWLIPAEYEALATLTMTRICVTLRWWVVGRLACMLAIGALTSLGMWLIGMPAPLALGTLAGLLSFVPNIGPIVAALPGLLLAVPEGPWMIVSAAGVYVGAQLIESNLIDPLVDQYTVTVPPAVLIVTQVIMAVLAGVWGVLIATPLLVVVLVLIQQLYVRECIKKPVKVTGSSDDQTPGGESPDRETDTPQEGPQPLTPATP